MRDTGREGSGWDKGDAGSGCSRTFRDGQYFRQGARTSSGQCVKLQNGWVHVSPIRHGIVRQLSGCAQHYVSEGSGGAWCSSGRHRPTPKAAMVMGAVPVISSQRSHASTCPAMQHPTSIEGRFWHPAAGRQHVAIAGSGGRQDFVAQHQPSRCISPGSPLRTSNVLCANGQSARLQRPAV